MGLSRLLVFVALLASATSSPIVQDVSEDELLSRAGDVTDASYESGPEGPLIPSSPDARIRRMTRGPPTWTQQPSAQSDFDLDDTEDEEQAETDDEDSFERPDTTSNARLLIQQPKPASCTYTMSESVASPCAWNGILTQYPSTTTAFREVSCNGCSDVFVHKEHYYCPIQRIESTELAKTASTYWSTVCAASTTSSLASPTQASVQTADAQPSTPRAVSPQPLPTQTRPFTTRMPIPTSLMHPSQTTLIPVTTPAPVTSTIPTSDLSLELRAEETDDSFQGQEGLLEGRGADPGPDGNLFCPTTFIVQPPKTAGVVWTQFSQIRTTTVYLMCAGCPSLVTSTAVMGYGQAGRFKSTTTAPVGYSTVYKCQ